MPAAVPFTVKIPPRLKRAIEKTASQRGQKPSETARAFLEEGVARHQPGTLLGAGAVLLASERIEPDEPAFPAGDWKSP